MRPYWQSADGRLVLYLGDALRVLAELPEAHVDVLLTDPPYSSGGAFRGDRIQDVHTKYVQSDSVAGNALEAFSGDNRDQRAYGYWVALWLGESLRVVKQGGIAALFTDWRQLPMTTDALQAGGYVWRGIVPWHKPSARPTQGRWANACEYVIWGTNGPRGLEGSAFPGFFSVPPPRSDDRIHITQKPVSLIREMLQLVPDDGVILDPFLGSGTTLLAAQHMGHQAIGIEMNERIAELAARRLEDPPLLAATRYEQATLEAV